MRPIRDILKRFRNLPPVVTIPGILVLLAATYWSHEWKHLRCHQRQAITGLLVRSIQLQGIIEQYKTVCGQYPSFDELGKLGGWFFDRLGSPEEERAGTNLNVSGVWRFPNRITTNCDGSGGWLYNPASGELRINLGAVRVGGSSVILSNLNLRSPADASAMKASWLSLAIRQTQEKWLRGEAFALGIQEFLQTSGAGQGDK